MRKQIRTRLLFLSVPFIICFCMMLISCKPGTINQLVLNGEPVAKTVMWVSCDLPGLGRDHKITWSVSESRTGKWTELVKAVHETFEKIQRTNRHDKN